MDVSIYPLSGTSARDVDRYLYEKTVKHQDLTAWLSSVTAVLFTFIPPIEAVELCRRNRVRCCALPPWHTYMRSDKRAIAELDHVFVTNAAVSEFFKTRGASDVIDIGWDSGLPLIRKQPQVASQIRMFLPLWDGNIRKTETTILDVIASLLDSCDAISVDVAVSRSSLKGTTNKRLGHLRAKYNSRFKVLAGLTSGERDVSFQRYDITVLPFHYDNVGLLMYQALASGNQVVAFDVAPFNTMKKCAALHLANGDVQRNEIGCPLMVEPDYNHLMQQIVKCFHDTPQVVIDPHLEAKSQQFESAMDAFCSQINC